MDSETVSTFHSFGLTILKGYYNKLGYDKNFTILDSDDSLTVVKKILKDMEQKGVIAIEGKGKGTKYRIK